MKRIWIAGMALLSMLFVTGCMEEADFLIKDIRYGRQDEQTNTAFAGTLKETLGVNEEMWEETIAAKGNKVSAVHIRALVSVPEVSGMETRQLKKMTDRSRMFQAFQNYSGDGKLYVFDEKKMPAFYIEKQLAEEQERLKSYDELLAEEPDDRELKDARNYIKKTVDRLERELKKAPEQGEEATAYEGQRLYGIKDGNYYLMGAGEEPDSISCIALKPENFCTKEDMIGLDPTIRVKEQAGENLCSFHEADAGKKAEELMAQYGFGGFTVSSVTNLEWCVSVGQTDERWYDGYEVTLVRSDGSVTGSVYEEFIVNDEGDEYSVGTASSRQEHAVVRLNDKGVISWQIQNPHEEAGKPVRDISLISYEQAKEAIRGLISKHPDKYRNGETGDIAFTTMELIYYTVDKGTDATMLPAWRLRRMDVEDANVIRRQVIISALDGSEIESEARLENMEDTEEEKKE